MALGTVSEREIEELERRLTSEAVSHEPFTLTPAWWQQRLLDWATTDPDFRVKLLRFVDVLPTLRSARAVADHVRQYFRDAHPGLVHAASGFAAQAIFRPVLSRVVRQGVFAMAGRFIAGAGPKNALPALRRLTGDGIAYTVDLLGEETLSAAEADAYLDRYLDLIETLSADSELSQARPGERRSSSPPAVNISIKLSALCPHLEPAAPQYVSAAARERLRPLLRAARGRRAFVNFDMEQYHYKELVHTTFEDVLLEQEFSDYPHTGIVVQAYLRDALDDIDRLLALAQRRGTPFTVRLVKGAYWDEENIFAGQNSWPAPVWEQKAETDASFERCTDALLAAWPHLRAAFGTHNPRSVAQAVVKTEGAGLSPGDIEFQMLYGMAEELRRAVAAEGYLTRVYAPVGEVIPGMAYLVRRLLENTSNQAWFNMGARSTDRRARQPGELSLQPDGSAVTPTARAEDRGTQARRRPVFENAAPAQFFVPAVRQAMVEAMECVQGELGKAYPLLVGGAALSDREQAEVRYPADPAIFLGHVAQATQADVDSAVRAARDAFPAWRDLPAGERGDILRRAADIIERRRFDFAATMVFESAKPWHEADGDVIEAIDYLRYYALQGEYLAEPLSLPQEDCAAPGQAILGERNEHFREGRGVTAVIAPWNFPLAIICGMSVGALAGGNCAILKPAAQSPIIAFKLVEALREAGVPAGAVQYLPGPGVETGQALVEDPAVDNIAFTGSSEVGLWLIESAAGRPSGPAKEPGEAPGQRWRPNVKRVVAEMGGKNAVIIDEDADLDQAIQGVITSAFGYAGQKCSACSRLVIVGSAYEEALARLKNAVASLVVGPPDDPATIVPPVIGEDARRRLLGYIESGRTNANLLVQAPIPGAVAEGGYYVPPTVFTDVPLDSAIACEEIFGPVLAVFRAADFEEAMRIALHSDFALTGGVFSRNPRHITMARRAFRVGNLYINRRTTGAIVGRQPFGGLHMSGAGEKAGGPDYVRQFMDSRTVSENTARRGFAPEAGE